jgi:hypothetical protein
MQHRHSHCDKAGAGIVPLDIGWDMQGERYAMPEVVESVLWANAELTPAKFEEFCTKMCRFKPSTACIQDIIARDGTGMAAMLAADKQGVAWPVGESKFPMAQKSLSPALMGPTYCYERKGSDADVQRSVPGSKLPGTASATRPLESRRRPATQPLLVTKTQWWAVLVFTSRSTE